MAFVCDLPDELLLKVFSYLDFYDISSTMSVCERWNNISKDHMLWDGIEFKNDSNMRLENLDGVLNTLPKPCLALLKHVKISYRVDTTHIIHTFSEHCPNLIGFKMICCCYINEIGMEILLNRYKNLETLSLEKCCYVSSQCFENIVHMSNLTELNLSNTNLTSDQFISISVACRKIVSLNIDFVRRISESDLISFLSLRYQTLRSLTVFGELLTDNIFQHFEKCSKLKLLHISRCQQFSDDCFKSIDKLTTLRSLTLKKAVHLSPEALHNFYFSSCISKCLSYLYISAQRQISVKDISLWFNNETDIYSSLVGCDGICILLKKGFNIHNREYLEAMIKT